MIDYPHEDIPAAIGTLLNFDFSQRFYTQADIKNIFARVKISPFAQ